MKQQKEGKNYLAVFCALGVLFLTCQSGFCATNYNYYLERGISSLNNNYDSEGARNNFAKILNAPLASDRIKVRAYFWEAYSYLFDGNKDKAEMSFRNLFGFKDDISYRYEVGIDDVLLKNNELMRIYDLEYRKYYRQASEGLRLGIEGTRDTQQKNTGMRLIILGSILSIALILSFI